MRISDWSSDVCSSDLSGKAAERGPVTPCILQKRFILRDPDVAAPALQPIVEDASRDLTPLPRTGAVSQEVALAIGAALLCLLKTDPFLAGREPAGGELGPGMDGIDAGFELRGGAPASRDGTLRKSGHRCRERGLE